MREGDSFEVSKDGYSIGGEVLRVEADGSRTVRLSGEEHLDRLGVIALPPYIRGHLDDAELHFTPGLLERLRTLGVELAGSDVNDESRPTG